MNETGKQKVDELKVRCRKRAWRLVSPENIRTVYEVIRLAAWIWNNLPWR
ncbi:hypothetical protein ACWDWT_00400 [Streptomyces sp. NPDC003343]